MQATSFRQKDKDEKKRCLIIRYAIVRLPDGAISTYYKQRYLSVTKSIWSAVCAGAELDVFRNESLSRVLYCRRADDNDHDDRAMPKGVVDA